MKKRSNFKIMLSLIGLVKPLAFYMIVAVIMGVVGNLCASFITVFGGFAVLNVSGYNTPKLYALFTLAVIFAVLRGILRYAEQACNHYIAFKLLALIRNKVFDALRRLCPAKLEGRDKGDLISVITSDIELLEVFYAHTVSPICIAVVYSVVMLVFIGHYSVCLALVALAGYICVGAVIPVLISKSSGESGMNFRNESGSLSSFVLDSLRGISQIIQFNYGRKRSGEMTDKTRKLSFFEKKVKDSAGKTAAVTDAVILLFDTAMLIVSCALYFSGKTGFDGVLIPTVAMMSSFGPCVALANLGSTLQYTFASGNRVLDILSEEPVAYEISGKEQIEFGGASADDVTFSYANASVLNGISLDVPKDSIVGIVGKSGSGKSTLLKLFMRFWSVDSGRISVSGKNINEINTSNLRDMQSLVTQDTQLFHDSIKNNLKIAKLDATKDEIVAACKKASIHDFIMSLPQGYNTPVGELGDTLSGGEKQRLGLARAFLHDALFMLLDEPTSNLDSLNEAVILKSLKEQRSGKTVVLVSHRQSTMQIADKIYSVENGKIN